MRVLIDADSLFFDVFSTPPSTTVGYQRIYEYRHSYIPTEISDKLITTGVERVRRWADSIGGRFFTDDVKIAVKGTNNFRYELYPEYKASRKNQQNTTILRDLVGFAIEAAADAGWVVRANGMEADDLVSIWAKEARTAGEEHVIVHIDKDLDCIKGTHWNFRHEVGYEVSQEKARFNLHKQIIVGDSTDNIPGARRIGEVKSAKYVRPEMSNEELHTGVVQAYMDAHPEDWEEKLQLNGSLVYLLRSYDDSFNLLNWV